jgi:putative FmdB family regulatory protein
VPRYQYACTEPACGHEFEAIQSFSDPALASCPVCEGKLRKVFSAVGVVFKGSGFYRNDSRSEASKKSGSSSSGSTKEPAGASSNSSSGSSADSAGSSSSSDSSTSSGTSSSPSSTNSSSTPSKAAAAG